jgi:hypothetical protein
LRLEQEERYHSYQISKQKLILAGLNALKLAEFHKVPFLSTFAAWPSGTIFGRAPKSSPRVILIKQMTVITIMTIMRVIFIPQVGKRALF